MDQQELPMSSRVNTATTIEQEKKQPIAVNEEFDKDRVTVRHNIYDEEDCSYMLRVLGEF